MRRRRLWPLPETEEVRRRQPERRAPESDCRSASGRDISEEPFATTLNVFEARLAQPRATGCFNAIDQAAFGALALPGKSPGDRIRRVRPRGNIFWY